METNIVVSNRCFACVCNVEWVFVNLLFHSWLNMKKERRLSGSGWLSNNSNDNTDFSNFPWWSSLDLILLFELEGVKSPLKWPTDYQKPLLSLLLGFSTVWFGPIFICPGNGFASYFIQTWDQHGNLSVEKVAFYVSITALVLNIKTNSLKWVI